MNITNFWTSSGTNQGGGGGDAGDPIGQSLRFRGAQNLVGPNLTQTLGTNTMSMWVKRGKLASNLGLYGTSFRGYGVYFNGSDFLTPNTNTLVASSSVYRDTSAWCHFVFNADGAFCNGERVPAFAYDNNLYVADASDAMVVGAIHTSTYYFDGYIAEVHFIDGSSLEPTTFGRYNSEGVWVPVDPERDGDTVWYGANGFHLTFADPGNVGKDYSGNGNDFTANGFDTSSFVSGYWVDAVYAATSGEIPNSQGQVYITDVQPANASIDYTNAHTIQDAFDGNLSTFIYLVGDEYATGNMLSMTFDLRDYSSLQSLELLTANNNLSTDHSYRVELLDSSKTLIAGTQVALPQADFASPEWISVPVSGTPRYFRFWTTPLAGSVYKRCYLFAIRINGQILSQSAVTAPTYDIMEDGPTNNFATLNPLYPNTAPTYTNSSLFVNANLGANSSSGVYKSGLSTQVLQHNCYWEVTYVTTPSSSTYSGLSLYTSNQGNIQSGFWGYVTTQGSSGSYVENGTAVSGGTAPVFSANDVAGYAYDHGNNTLQIFRNGTSLNTINVTQGLELFANHRPYGSDQYRINFGQQPFRYTPPAGFEPLNTANMPASTIANGRDHFRAITDTGASILTDAQAAFPSGLWWIKDRANANQHQLVDVMNGTANVLQSPAGTVGNNYTAPAGDSVAWCWRAGDTAVANTNGTTDSTIRANPDAGFSIVQWTADGTATQTVGHGLNARPDFVFQNPGNGLIPAWHSSGTPAAGYVYLNTTLAWSTNSDILDSAAMTATTIGTYQMTNGTNMTAYVWTAIPGYSAFGSYTGNGSADGPFVYTGFRPAFVLIKATNSAQQWYIQDSTRDISNPVSDYLIPSANSAEASLDHMDFLSNGFKLRTTNGAWNGSFNYIYAAFAENPFQSPVTAR